jgi:hypothetical protein
MVTQSPAIQVAWVEDGDHNFTPRKTSAQTKQKSWEAALGEILTFLEARLSQTEGKSDTRNRP